MKTLLVIVGFIWVTISSVTLSELSARMSAKSFVSQKIDKLEKSLTDSSSNGNDKSAPSGDGSQYVSELKRYNAIIDDLEHLSLTGAADISQTIYAIRSKIAQQALSESNMLTDRDLSDQIDRISRERELIERHMIELNNKISETSDAVVKETHGAGVTGKPGEGPVARAMSAKLNELQDELKRKSSQYSELSLILRGLERRKLENVNLQTAQHPSSVYASLVVPFLPNELLLAITVIMCGSIGSILTSLRSRTSVSINSVFSGLLAGFIAFIAIKGGRSLLFIDYSGNPSAIVNPFSAALAGVLAGLFTEKAYRILSDITDQIGIRIVGNQTEDKK